MTDAIRQETTDEAKAETRAWLAEALGLTTLEPNEIDVADYIASLRQQIADTDLAARYSADVAQQAIARAEHAEAERDVARQQLSEAQADRDGLLRFAGNALTDARGDDIGDWDGGSLQEALTECGLIELAERAVPCGEDCRCTEFYDHGETAQCFPFTPLGHEAVRAYRAAQDAARSSTPTSVPASSRLGDEPSEALLWKCSGCGFETGNPKDIANYVGGVNYLKCPVCKRVGEFVDGADANAITVADVLAAVEPKLLASRAVQRLADSEPDADTTEAQDRLAGTPQESLFCFKADVLEEIIEATISDALYDAGFTSPTPPEARTDGQ